jgi:hypothetical protein
MNAKRIAALALTLALLPLSAAAGGRGGFSRSGGGGYHPPSGGFDFHGDSGAAHPPQTVNHSSTGPAGTSRTTTATNTGNGYNRSTTANNGGYSRTSTGSASNGNYSHSTNTSTPYGSHSSNGNANANTGNYNRNASGSDANGSYNSSASGNAYDHTYNKTTNGSNVYGQTYHSSTSAYNGTVYHGAYVTNPIYGGYPAWGWNAGMAWYPAPYYYGGGFWGAMAIGATTAALYGSIVAANSQTLASYQVQPQSPGAKLLTSYKLTQVPCGPPNLVVIYGPNNSAICAQPNSMVAAGYYNVDSSNLSIVSASPT